MWRRLLPTEFLMTAIRNSERPLMRPRCRSPFGVESASGRRTGYLRCQSVVVQRPGGLLFHHGLFPLRSGPMLRGSIPFRVHVLMRNPRLRPARFRALLLAGPRNRLWMAATAEKVGSGPSIPARWKGRRSRCPKSGRRYPPRSLAPGCHILGGGVGKSLTRRV